MTWGFEECVQITIKELLSGMNISSFKVSGLFWVVCCRQLLSKGSG